MIREQSRESSQEPAAVGPRAMALVTFALLLVFGILFAVLTPPFATPDETGHWLHAVALSGGDAWGATPAVTVPAWSRAFLDSYAPGGDVSALSAQPRFVVSVTGETTTVELHNVASYNAAGYLPAAVGVRLARGAGLSPLAIFRAGRLAVTLVCSLLIALAISLAGTGRALLALVALGPMAVALRASCSPDALLLAAAILVVGVLVSPDRGRREATRSLLAATAALLMVAIKPPYLPLAATAALAVRRLPVSRRARLAIAGALVAALTGTALAASAAALDAARRTVFRFDASVDATLQARHAAEHPLAIATLLTRDLVSRAPRYAREAIGVLGWLDVPLPGWAYLLSAVTLLAAAIWRRAVEPPVPAPLVVGAFVATLFLVALSLYFIWTPVGADRLEGFQGRYLLPVLPLIAALPPLRRRLEMPRAGELAALLAASAVLAVALRAIVQRYSGM